MEKLTQFATAVGADVKQINQAIDSLQREVTALKGKPEGVTLETVEQKITDLRTALFGGDLEEAYDTFKEIADKLKEVGGTVGGAITEKLAELGRDLTACKSAIEADLVSVYTSAKTGT